MKTNERKIGMESYDDSGAAMLYREVVATWECASSLFLTLSVTIVIVSMIMVVGIAVAEQLMGLELFPFLLFMLGLDIITIVVCFCLEGALHSVMKSMESEYPEFQSSCNAGFKLGANRLFSMQQEKKMPYLWAVLIIMADISSVLKATHMDTTGRMVLSTDSALKVVNEIRDRHRE